MLRLLCSIAAFAEVVVAVFVIVAFVVFAEKSGARLLARGRLTLHCTDLAGIDADLHVSSIGHC